MSKSKPIDWVPWVILMLAMIVGPIVYQAVVDDPPAGSGGTYYVDDYEPAVRN